MKFLFFLKYEAEFRAVMCIICSLFLAILLGLGKEERESRMQAAALAWGPWFGDSVAHLGSPTFLWVFMENISLPIYSMSTVLPVLMEKIFNFIQVTNSTYPLFTAHTLGG